jgi:hypothetical protein
VAVNPIERPSRFRLTYAFELVALDGSGRGANRVWNFPINPERISIKTRPGAQVSQLAGGVALEESGVVLHDITISGTTGLEHKRGWRLESDDPLNPQSGLTYADGNELHKELRKWFDFYWATKRNPDASTRWAMVFHDFRGGRHWLILPTEMAEDRSSGQHRLHYPYELEFTAVLDVDALDVKGVSGLFGKIRDVADAINGAILSVVGYIADAEAFLGEVDATFVQPVRQTIAAVNEAAGAIQGVVRAAQGLVRAPRRLVEEARDAVGNLITLILGVMGLDEDGQLQRVPWAPGLHTQSMAGAMLRSSRDCERALDAAIIEASLWRRDLDSAQRDRRRLSSGEQSLTALEASGDGSLQLGARVQPGSAARRLRPRGYGRSRSWGGVREYVVLHGDTLRSIAINEVGDPAAWVDLASLNDLRAPYISPTGMGRTVRPGQSLLLPTLGDGGQTTTIERDIANLEREVLGTTLKLTDVGGFEVNAAGDDFVYVSGMDAYIQNVERVLFLTELGENTVYPRSGMLRPVGEKNGAGMPEAVAVSARRAALQDPRTGRVVDVDLVEGGDSLSAVLTLQPRALGGPVLVSRRV